MFDTPPPNPEMPGQADAEAVDPPAPPPAPVPATAAGTAGTGPAPAPAPAPVTTTANMDIIGLNDGDLRTMFAILRRARSHPDLPEDVNLALFSTHLIFRAAFQTRGLDPGPPPAAPPATQNNQSENGAETRDREGDDRSVRESTVASGQEPGESSGTR